MTFVPAPWLNTATGRRFNFLAPKPEDVDIVDIAISLGNQCRYAGHTRHHYSVAMHSVIIAHTLDRLGCDAGAVAWGLMHDAAEAYVTDVPWPLKAAGLVDGLRDVERNVMRVICQRFGLEGPEPDIVKALDLEILDIEAEWLIERHADWPKGTPRSPRVELRKAFNHYFNSRCMYREDKAAESFIAKAHSLGLATSEDVARLDELREKP